MRQIITGLRRRGMNRLKKDSRHGSRRVALEWLEGRVLLTSVPTGLVSVFSTTQISGWGFNADDGSLPVNIAITINGVKTTVVADDNLASLAGTLGSPYHAFTFTPATPLPPGTSTVLVQAVSPTTGIAKTLKSGTLVNPAPLGQVTLSKDGSTITGWAHDASTPNAPIEVRVDVDGVLGTPFTTDVLRTDIDKKFKVTNNATFGFNLTGSFLGHVVEVWGIDQPSGTASLLFTNNKLPKGKVEVNDGFTVKGWAQDPDNPTASINIRVDIDGVTLAGTPTPANVERQDLVNLLGSADHGFLVTIPGLTPGKHTIAVYAIDGQASSAKPVLLQKKTVTDAVPIGHVDSISSTSVSGWALDPDLGASPATVNVYVDDHLFGSFNANGNQAGLTGTHKNHGFTVDLSSLPAGSHSITLTVTDNRTSDESEVVFFDSFINNHQPIGQFESANGTTLTGWAFDPDTPDSPIPVDIYVDGVYAKTVTADISRPDVAALPSPDHGFSAALPALSFGTHKIDIYASESQGNVSVLIGSKTVTNNRPIGSIDSSSTTTVAGWAADPDVLGTSIQVQVYVNGVPMGDPVAANIDRPDLLTQAPFSTQGSNFDQYGYSITLTGLVSGNNQVDVYAIDPNNGMLSPLGSKVITI